MKLPIASRSTSTLSISECAAAACSTIAAYDFNGKNLPVGAAPRKAVAGAVTARRSPPGWLKRATPAA
ncbi:hypothetical protein BURKHO8Y_180016 [Burkholderia sp. 8Y]|uniref:hypothetical protein n=1 Tax=Burkholderia sp. 8Y TaxID=2653133 RepID=UPI0012F2D2C6|nr:hypothetical protein [Burkholderia sp. 8Y]VXC00778.1 hypothetical protein BURKHO8Y_180016 [Burkholderia sp. 8Y]